MVRAVWFLCLASVLVLAGCGGSSPAEKPRAYGPRRPGISLAVYDSGLYGPMSLLASPGRLTTNADMVVVCTREGRVIKKWKGQAHWNGTLPDRYEGWLRQGRLVWMGLGLNSKQVRLEVRADGSGGVTLEQWLDPRCDHFMLTVNPVGEGTEEGSLGEEGARIHDDALGEEGTHARRATGGHGRKSGRANTPGGKRGGSPTGMPGGLPPGEGVDSPNARRGGQKHGDPEGAIGGEGKPGDRGARGAVALFGGILSVPMAVRPLVEVILIAEDVSMASLVKTWASKPLSKLTLARMRKELKQEATRYAKARLGKYLPQLRRSLREVSAKEAERIVLRLQWALERRYFTKLQEGAEALADTARQKLKKHKSGKLYKRWEHARQQAELLIEMTRVKPIAGRLPVNHQYAGQWFPSELLPKRHRKKGLRFTEDGYPDFSPHAKRLPNGQRSVKIELTGNQEIDERLAGKIAGLPGGKKPEKHTWHHHQDGTTMELVPTDLHKSVSHTGGRSHYRDRTGDKTAYGKDRR